MAHRMTILRWSLLAAGFGTAMGVSAEPQRRLSVDFDQGQHMKAKGSNAIVDPRSKYPQVGKAFYIKTLVKEGASLGANSTIVCGHTIGRFAFVGAGAVVTKDIPDFALVVGNPARIVGWMSEAGVKLSFGPDGIAHCSKSGKKYKMEKGIAVEVQAGE